jgi:putative hydrolase of the HAD superfamily
MTGPTAQVPGSGGRQGAGRDGRQSGGTPPDGIVAIISDFGGVLTTPLLDAFLAVQNSLGISPQEFGAALRELAARDGVNPLFELERGRITESHFLTDLSAQLSTALGRPVSVHGFGTSLMDELHPNVPMIDCMRQLRARGLRMAICTNNVREWEAQWRAKLPVDEIFDVVVDSAFVGSRKPERRIYELTLERLGVTASSALFIDDMELNCNAARELGINAIQFRSTDQTLEEIEATLGAHSAA